MDEMRSGLPGPEAPEDGEDGLSVREREAARELRFLDPHLAGLYERGLALARQIDQPGNAYLVAHAGRELSRGVLQLLLRNEGLEVTPEDLESVPSNERNRQRIAEALDLEPNDPRVDEWFYLVRQFSGTSKWRFSGLQAATLREAYERLSSLLYGRLAPYYVTERELDTLLEVRTPTREHARQLRDLQLRPGQRTYFFQRLRTTGWVKYLAAEGFFRSPPSRQDNADGSWSTRPWPQGDFLVLAAADEPRAVLEVLKSIPLTNDNPVVWGLVARAAQRLPPDVAVHLVPLLTNALKTDSAPIFSEDIVDLAIALAEAGQNEAFELSDYLLYVLDHRQVDEKARQGLEFNSSTEWVFPRFGYHNEDELCTRLVAALSALDSKETLQLVLTKIQRVERLIDNLDFGLPWRLMRLETERHSDRDDVVEMLVVHAVELAQRMGAKGPDEAEWVMEAIDSLGGELFSRIRYRVLAQVGSHLPYRLDQVLRSAEARNPSFHAVDLAELLRAQFRNASGGARQDYADAVEAGPDRGCLRRILRRFFPVAARSESDRRWQRRILRFFRGDVPEELRDLARELGVLDVQPSVREQQMAEVGAYSNGVSWGWGGSPLSPQQLSERTPDDVITVLREWRPSEEFGSAFALRDSLATYAVENARAALSVLNRAVEDGVHPSAIQGILDGLADGTKAETDLEWREVLAGVGRVVRHVTTLEVNGTQGIEQWRSTAGRGTRLIEEGCRKDSIPCELASEVWAVLDEATRVPAIWQVRHYQHGSLEAVITAELNDASGNVATAVMSAALWDYRCRMRSSAGLEEDRVRARGHVQEPLLPILDRWLGDDQPNAAVPRAVMGDYLPQLYLLAPEWIDANAANLFQDGLEDPLRRPTWTTYTSRCRLYDDVFRATRSWYLRSAEQATVWRDAAGDLVGQRKSTQKYAEHLMIAVLRGLVSVGDHDALLETAYDNLIPSDWGYAYWRVFRVWSDAADPPPSEAVQQLVRLWEWRVSQLRVNADPMATVEEAKQLGWLFHTPYIPDADIVRLGLVTAQLAQGQLQMYSRWDRMLSLAHASPDETFLIAETVLLAELRADYPHVPVEDVRSFLSYILTAGTADTIARVRRLINRLGERGYRLLKDLLDENGGVSD